jgi:trans-2,3-dihydro-3-hydroxyanthranilate isomerase
VIEQSEIMKYKFHIVDVFSASAFGGNQLAVLPEASGISPEGMQKIAREFNFAETTFVLPAQDASHTCRVRIFTPKAEVPFAGHPTVGTACALVMGGHVGRTRKLILKEGIGPVGVEVEERGSVLHGTLILRAKVDHQAANLRAEDLAAVLSLSPADVKQAFFASVGLPFCFVQLVSSAAVDRAVINKSAWTQHLAEAFSPHIFFFAGELEDGAELHARMFAPAVGVEEDPATGSACAALVGVLATTRGVAGETCRLSIKQGVAMSRPSEIEAMAETSADAVTSIHVGGATTYVGTGEIEVPAAFVDA